MSNYGIPVKDQTSLSYRVCSFLSILEAKLTSNEGTAWGYSSVDTLLTRHAQGPELDSQN